MNIDYFIVKNPMTISSIALSGACVLHADSKYEEKRDNAPYGNLVALKTINGEGKVKIEGCDEITVVPGTLLFFKQANVRHYYCTDKNWDFWWFEFSANEVLDIQLNALLKVDFVANELNYCKSCLKLLKKNDNSSSYLASATFCLLLYSWLQNQINETKINPNHYMIQKSIDYLKEDIKNTVTVKDMAGKAGLCERRFRQVFKNITGMQPKTYIEDLCMNLAEGLLKNTSFSINEISQKLGYSSQFHFSKVFKKLHGMSPSNYRRNESNVIYT
ncbi:MAG: AraC family transcriptional regulator [Saccharofermentanales bacterium]